MGDTRSTLIEVDGLKPIPTYGDRLPNRIRGFTFFRDGGCQADGCTSRYRLEPHHVIHRAQGGDHDQIIWYCCVDFTITLSSTNTASRLIQNRRPAGSGSSCRE